MASIQQSMNALMGSALGIATAGSYMYRQSHTYKDKLAEKEANSLQTILDEGQYEALNPEKTLKEQETLQKGVVEARKEAYKLKPTTERHNKLFDAYGALGDTQTLITEEEARKKVIAEEKALSRLADKINAQTAQQEARKDRFDMLREVASAKERGQLDTMYNRHKNKGEID